MTDIRQIAKKPLFGKHRGHHDIRRSALPFRPEIASSPSSAYACHDNKLPENIEPQLFHWRSALFQLKNKTR
jgi:hypothetical protein